MTPTCGRFGGKTATGKLIRGLIGIPRCLTSRTAVPNGIRYRLPTGIQWNLVSDRAA
jgi:hypothetical protein